MSETLQEANQQARRYLSNKWVKWVHNGSKPSYTSAEKNINAVIGSLGKHCAICLNLNGCCFIIDKKPILPAHQNCHCVYQNISAISATAVCPIEKFTGYIFNDIKNNGKKQLFEAWGYSREDSQELKILFEQQAQKQYELGEYELVILDKYGQRINIIITLKNKNTDETIKFYFGWMVYPDGRIDLATPYGRK